MEEETNTHYVKLYIVVLITILLSSAIAFLIYASAFSNAGLGMFFYCLIFYLPILVIITVVFFLLLKTRFAKFINKKSVGVFCVILATILIAPAIIGYYNTVPPKEVTNVWIVDDGQDLQSHIVGMTIIYDRTYGWKSGYFLIEGAGAGGYVIGGNESYKVLEDNPFVWSYNELSNEILIQESSLQGGDTPTEYGWSLTLRLDIDKSEEPHYTMTTNYVSDFSFILFNATLFDNVNWTGAWDYNDQGR